MRKKQCFIIKYILCPNNVYEASFITLFFARVLCLIPVRVFYSKICKQDGISKIGILQCAFSQILFCFCIYCVLQPDFYQLLEQTDGVVLHVGNMLQIFFSIIFIIFMPILCIRTAKFFTKMLSIFDTIDTYFTIKERIKVSKNLKIWSALLIICYLLKATIVVYFLCLNDYNLYGGLIGITLTTVYIYPTIYITMFFGICMHLIYLVYQRIQILNENLILLLWEMLFKHDNNSHLNLSVHINLKEKINLQRLSRYDMRILEKTTKNHLVEKAIRTILKIELKLSDLLISIATFYSPIITSFTVMLYQTTIFNTFYISLITLYTQKKELLPDEKSYLTALCLWVILTIMALVGLCSSCELYFKEVSSSTVV